MSTFPHLVLSLFPGLELLDRAFRELGFCVVAGPDRLLGADVREFHPPPGRFDGVIGGSPCQSFSSLANLVRIKKLRNLGLTYWPQGRDANGAKRDVVDIRTGEVLFEGTLLEIDIRYEVGPGNLVPEFERVVVEAQPLWFLHENVPRAPIPRPEGYVVSDFTICNSSIEGEDGLGQEQERVRRFAFGVRGEGPAPNLLRWISRAALRLPAASRTGAVSQARVDNSPEAKGRIRVNGIVRTEAPGQRRPTKEVLAERARVRQAAVFGDGRETRDSPKMRQPAVAYDDGPGTRERLRLPPLTGENGTKYETPRVRRPPVLADPGSENRRDRQATMTGAHQTSRRPKGGHGERRSLPEMLRLQGLPEDLLDDQPFTSKAARKMVANGVPMPLGRAVARAVVKALEELADPAGKLLAWRDDEITELIRSAA